MPPSFVWKYFTKTSSSAARCNETGCGKTLACNNGTKGMISHLKTFHNIVDPSREKLPAVPTADSAASAPSTAGGNETEAPPKSKRQKLMFDYLDKGKPTLEKEIAKMAAGPGTLSFNTIAKVPFIRESLANKYPGEIIPKGHSDVALKMMNFYEYAVADVKNKIRKLKEGGTKFSATLDEWTSIANRKFLNVNVHYKSKTDDNVYFINLGLLKLSGHFPSEKLVILVRLLNAQDIFGSFIYVFFLDYSSRII